MLAAIRRGPFAAPTDDEMIEYLITRKRRDQERPRFEHFSLEHVLHFQRRVHALKKQFFRRGVKTPLGRLREWWDRTEAQMRAARNLDKCKAARCLLTRPQAQSASPKALHSHILCWFRLRDEDARDEKLKSAGLVYEPLGSVPRTAPGNGPKQRPAAQPVPHLKQTQEDDLYQKAEVGRVSAEMVRPDLSAKGWTADTLRIAGLARAVQSRLYLHNCTPKYCLANRGSCRFMFPWPRQPQQQYCENAERVALRRRCVDDDQWVVPHNIYVAMFSPATVNVLPFDPSPLLGTCFCVLVRAFC
jgi:hypothetical protein